ncbi:DUF1287 domain-containing protein [Flavobacterium zepuense]|uniref:DUF1287 domain-containing protein n=1 Tax=Flavobacterium zepuense TaxID=2593302 RepID=A0A552V476_9FLAO|nr:DUF1287 domain-containing protein [Flavobacterium zepuense]TRW25261.1 DUF1287 domain-containing protein [Flavobacterium zepuense]
MKHILLLLLISCLNSSTATKDYYEQLSDAALAITKDKVEYDGTYYRIKYPNGDVPANIGVCTDVVIRSYRKLGADLQQLVHEDMKANFSKYPKAWGLSSPDTNIDHRRVPNLQVFFTRKGQKLTVTNNASDYKPGDIVTWMLPAGHPHIGIVVNKKGAAGRYKMVHNIGYGQNLDDCLFEYKITGHYRYKK